MMKLLRGNFFLTLITLLYFGVNSFCYSSREIEFTKNPNCTSDCEKPWIIYGRGENDNNTIHYLWSSVELPSFVMALSVPESEIRINWTKLQEGWEQGSISFTKKPENVFGMSFQTLILFNDVNDTGKLDNIPEKDKKYVSLSEFNWKIDKYENISSQEFVVQFSTFTFKNESLDNDTKISISVTAFGTEGRANTLPHLMVTSDSAQLKVTLDHLILDLSDMNFSSGVTHQPKPSIVPISGFDHPRWALDTIILSSDIPATDELRFHFQEKKSIDDEHTPGVFDLNAITTEGARQTSSTGTSGGYLQWRPVCYLTTEEDINDSTYPNFNTSLPPIDEEHLEKAKISLMYALFGEELKNLSNQTTIAFGLPDDDFYTEYNYTVWTFSMGLGTVPQETFSTVLIIVIAVGVGLPLVLFFVGIIFLGFKKFRGRGELLINED